MVGPLENISPRHIRLRFFHTRKEDLILMREQVLEPNKRFPVSLGPIWARIGRREVCLRLEVDRRFTDPPISALILLSDEKRRTA
jgi:hypothetical protein